MSVFLIISYYHSYIRPFAFIRQWQRKTQEIIQENGLWAVIKPEILKLQRPKDSSLMCFACNTCNWERPAELANKELVRPFRKMQIIVKIHKQITRRTCTIGCIRYSFPCFRGTFLSQLFKLVECRINPPSPERGQVCVATPHLLQALCKCQGRKSNYLTFEKKLQNGIYFSHVRQ